LAAGTTGVWGALATGFESFASLMADLPAKGLL
jgi:hypothetical protein